MINAKYSRKRLMLRLFGLLALILIGSVGWTAVSIWTFDVTTDRNAEAAIILGASSRDGMPSPVFEERIIHGIELYKSGRVSFLIFTGGTGDGESTSDAEAARAYAVSKGVPEDAILVEEYSRITKENLAFAKERAESEGIESFLIVSDPLHLKRAMLIAEDLEMTAWPSATPTTKYRSLRKRLWFLRRETYFYIQYALFTRFIPTPTLPEAIQKNQS